MMRRITGLKEMACEFHATSFGFEVCHRYRRKPPSLLLNTSRANEGTMWISCCPIVKEDTKA
jgi:hypothetical protein